MVIPLSLSPSFLWVSVPPSQLCFSANDLFCILCKPIYCWWLLDCNRNTLPPKCELKLYHNHAAPILQICSVPASFNKPLKVTEQIQCRVRGWDQLLWIPSPHLFSLYQAASQNHKRYSYQCCLVGVRFAAVDTVKWNLRMPEVCCQTLFTFMNSSVTSSSCTDVTMKSTASPEHWLLKVCLLGSCSRVTVINAGIH